MIFKQAVLFSVILVSMHDYFKLLRLRNLLELFQTVKDEMI